MIKSYQLGANSYVRKPVESEQFAEATKQLGYPESAIVGIGVVLLISTFLYVIPRTAILGAILLTLLPEPDNAPLVTVGGPGKEFFVFGKNYPNATEPADLEVGGWRVELSPWGPLR